MEQSFQTIEQVMSNGNSIVNQEIKGQFIAKHVNANVNQMVEYILGKGYEDQDAPFNMEDVLNYYSYDEVEYQHNGETKSFTGTEADKEALIAELREEDENREEGDEANNEEAIHTLENAEEEASEVYEWWLVSEYLLTQLKHAGHPVIEDYSIWGRRTTGQAILLDGVITQICADMEILDGQKYSWAK